MSTQNNGWEAYYEDGIMTKCYWTGNTSQGDKGTRTNGTGILCDGGYASCSGSSPDYVMCGEGTWIAMPYYCCNTSIEGSNQQVGGMSTTLATDECL